MTPHFELPARKFLWKVSRVINSKQQQQQQQKTENTSSYKFEYIIQNYIYKKLGYGHEITQHMQC